MKKISRILVIMVMVASIVVSSLLLTGCPAKGPKTYYNNDTDKLMFSTQDVDGLFNPFFATSGADSNIVGMTQLGMLANDAEGNLSYGEDEACVVLDYEQKYNEETDTTTYYLVLKNNIKFSNGSPLTMKDVLFNLYVYLDPLYTGSATIYSTKIVGLQAYRTNSYSEDEQKNFRTQFEVEARARIDDLLAAFTSIKKSEGSNFVVNDEASFREKLEEYVEIEGLQDSKILIDYDKARELFKKEVENDYNNSRDSYAEIMFTDDKGDVHKNFFSTDVEAFLYNEGYYKWNKKEAKLTSSLVNDDELAQIKTWTKEKAINTVYEHKMPTALDEVLLYWGTATDLFEYIANQSMIAYFKEIEGTGIQDISGIRFANYDKEVKVNGKVYGVPTYEGENYSGAVVEGNEVLSIEIEKVDPKAKWNFAFAVAPMYYYSSDAEIAKFDYKTHFGVTRTEGFLENVVNDSEKNGVPVGAGPYMASNKYGETVGIRSNDFKNNNIIYFKANPYYLLGEPLIKNITYQVIPTAQLLTALYTGQIDFAEPSAKPETISELNAKKSEGIGNKPIKTSGYGYIGVNAAKVPSIYVRQAIMHSINTQLCVDYYKSKATAIYRSMSTASWAYPDGCTSYYPYIGDPIPANLDIVNPEYKAYVQELGKTSGERLNEAEQKGFITYLLEDCAGYRLNANGVYQKGTSTCKYVFTIAGQETDHPAYKAMYLAGQFLNKCGFEINVTPDSDALSKLSRGDLTVWAAAWGSTIDPDMYQVYHKESKATSTLNWGYNAILKNEDRYPVENQLITKLSELIDQAREIEGNDNARAAIYSEALDIVMQLAIELPTYQRDDLFAYNANKIDVNTFNQNPSPFKGLVSDIHTISLVVEK